MRNNNLLTLLFCDLKDFLKNNKELIFNEKDLQVRITMWLKKKKHYDRVDMEYSVPKDELRARHLKLGKWSSDFPWDNDLSIDVVVEKDNQFAAVELKFATSPVINQPSRFGESLKTNCPIIKKQGANNLVMYNYWKDVRRIEALIQCYQNMIGGIALFITNDRIYWNVPKANVSYSAFSTHQGNRVGHGLLKWGTISHKIIKSHPDFKINGCYLCDWEDTAITALTKNGDRFRYLLTPSQQISQSDISNYCQ